jgi:hypothetical protein
LATLRLNRDNCQIVDKSPPSDSENAAFLHRNEVETPKMPGRLINSAALPGA